MIPYFFGPLTSPDCYNLPVPVQVIDSLSKIHLLDHLLTSDMVGMDTETRASGAPFEFMQVAILQLSSRN